jgi:hypothetical protein
MVKLSRRSFEATLKQLNALGYKEGDQVWVRLLVPKNVPEGYALGNRLGYRDRKGKFRKSVIDGYLTLSGSPTFT